MDGAVLIKSILKEQPIIFAVKTEEAFQKAIKSHLPVVFLLYGNLCNIADLVEQCKKAHKIVYVHIDLIEGLAQREAAIDFLAEQTLTDGVISTRAKLLHYAKEKGFSTILRVFQLDSMSIESIGKNVEIANPDFIECLPGIVTRYFKQLKDEHKTDIIAGGLLSSKEDVDNALKAGAIAVSMSGVGGYE